MLFAVFPKIAKQNAIVKKQINQNISVMERLYGLINAKNNQSVANFQEIQNFSKLRRFLLSLQEGKKMNTLRYAFPTMLSPTAWKILARIAQLHQHKEQRNLIRKLVLIE
ncbi:hypothetical protein [Oscillatoria salina]|uniref:hypothetical protein n=1 Tax=Oscillatoria salina TaxID=331517 RepID=UPI0013B797D1|nr:hypothetical protein [Oscillatoria salina]MBZ8178592.1 hypothetical protein [Oscillatoria salina IIICB1]NET87341.1 hypothetical protein [Kamptonema sp. SIO1D9]